MIALADDGSSDRRAWTFNGVSGSQSRGYRLATGRWILACTFAGVSCSLCRGYGLATGCWIVALGLLLVSYRSLEATG